MQLSELKISEFIEKLSSESAVPGGGSVAALSVALGVSLTEMAAKLTVGKKGYEEHSEKMLSVIEKCSEIKKQALAKIDEDAESFEEVMNAYKLPKETEEQKSVRKEAIQTALKEATVVPLSVCVLANTAYPLAEYVEKYGNSNANSDSKVALLMLKNGCMGALYNVEINLSSIKDIKDINFLKETRDILLEFQEKLK